MATYRIYKHMAMTKKSSVTIKFENDIKTLLGKSGDMEKEKTFGVFDVTNLKDVPVRVWDVINRSFPNVKDNKMLFVLDDIEAASYEYKLRINDPEFFGFRLKDKNDVITYMKREKGATVYPDIYKDETGQKRHNDKYVISLGDFQKLY